jgi:hypothetical protein
MLNPEPFTTRQDCFFSRNSGSLLLYENPEQLRGECTVIYEAACTGQFQGVAAGTQSSLISGSGCMLNHSVL